MKVLPDAMFIVDPKKESIAVREARSLKIPIVGICDTNCDPEEVDHIIPGNDDAVRAVKLLCHTMANAIIEGHEGEIPSEGSMNIENLDIDLPDFAERELDTSDAESEKKAELN